MEGGLPFPPSRRGALQERRGGTATRRPARTAQQSEPAWRRLGRVTRAAAAADCDGRGGSGAGDGPEDGMVGAARTEP